MKKIYKKYMGEIIVAIGALSYSFEWYFIRRLDNLGYSSYDITFSKLFIATFIIFLFIIIFKRNVFINNTLKKKDYFILFFLSLITILGNVLFNKSIVLTSISNVLIINYLSIFWVILLGFIFLNEKLKFKNILFSILAFIGIILVLINDIKSLSLELGLGEFYAFLLSIVFAISIVITKKMSHFSAFYRVGIIFLMGSFILLLGIININGISYLSHYMNKDFLIYGGFLAITAGLLGRGLKDLGTKYIPASLVLIIMLLVPIGQITTGYFIADETLSIINLIGIGIVFFSIIKISKKEA